MNIYVDTSFLVSLYTADANSASAEKSLRMSPGTLSITTLVELETVNALGLRTFRKEISVAQAQASLKNFDEDVRAGVFQLKALPTAVFERARQLSRQNTARLGTRTADLLHVAAALELGSERFYSFDKQQRKLAETVKLKVNSFS